MINRRILYYLIVSGWMILTSSCQPSNSQTTFDSEIVKQEVEAQIWAFHTADTSMNAEAMIDLLWPEYTMLADGKRISYDDVSQGSAQFMSNLTLFHTEWTDLEIIPVSADAALSSFIFKDSIINKSGELTRQQGPNTFLWQRRNGEWKLLYGDADHYPLD